VEKTPHYEIIFSTILKFVSNFELKLKKIIVKIEKNRLFRFVLLQAAFRRKKTFFVVRCGICAVY